MSAAPAVSPVTRAMTVLKDARRALLEAAQLLSALRDTAPKTLYVKEMLYPEALAFADAGYEGALGALISAEEGAREAVQAERNAPVRAVR